MAFKQFGDDSRRNFGPREMVKGNWNCSECGVEITELPFVCGHVFEVDDGKSPPKSLTLKAGDVFLFDSRKWHRLKEDAEGGAGFLGWKGDIYSTG